MIDYTKVTPDEFNWEEKMARPVMYCFRLSDYGVKSEKETYEEWESMNHSYSKDNAWFHGLYEYMLGVLDKCKAQGYNAFDEASVELIVYNRKNKKGE